MNEADFLCPQIPPTRTAVFVGESRYRRASYGSNHPLAIPRVSLTLDLLNAYGAMGPEEYVTGRPASHQELWGFHGRDYILAYERAQFRGRVTEPDRRLFHLGTLENPYFPGFFDTPNLAAGSSILAAEWVLKGTSAFSPSGGMHHAGPHQARGFCYLNDPVLAIQRLRKEGLRVLYWDMDAHHGDGVEAAFVEDTDVLTVSIHMDTSYAYPFRGGDIGDCSGGAVNMPLPPGINDSEYGLVFNRLWPEVLVRFSPDAVVLQAGTDILAPDPLSRFQVSNVCFWSMVRRIVEDSPRLLVLGGGGYHPVALARCWAGVWAILSGRRLGDLLPESGVALLRSVDWELDDEEVPDYSDQFVHLEDLPRKGPVRPQVQAALQQLFQEHPLLSPRSIQA